MKPHTGADQRRTKGTSLIQLVKLLRDLRHKRSLRLSPAGAALLEERILPSGWYSYTVFAELMQVAYEQLLGSSEESAMQMGLLAATSALSGPHGAFVLKGDPAATVLALRHLWRAANDFAALDAVSEGPNAVVFTLTGFPDLMPVHGVMTASWAVAAAQLAGSPRARCEILERPWSGAPRFRYRITF